MDKITRLLLLYSKLIKGERINKIIFCFENECSHRTFDRDIEKIRLYLSEAFCVTELKYDRSEKVYFIEGARKKLLEPMEYFLIEHILNDSTILRKDEFEILSKHLLDNTENGRNFELERQEICNQYKSPLHNKALLKMHGDLINVIRNKKYVNIKYLKWNGECVIKKVIPCEVKFDLGYLYLIAYKFDTNDEYPAYYRIDRIDSFEILNNQNCEDQDRVSKYLKKYAKGITQMYGGEYVEIKLQCLDNYYSYIFDKFRNVEIISKEKQYLLVKISAFEDGFIKWIMSQSPNNITVIAPNSTIEKIKSEAKKIINKYEV